VYGLLPCLERGVAAHLTGAVRIVWDNLDERLAPFSTDSECELAASLEDMLRGWKVL